MDNRIQIHSKNHHKNQRTQHLVVHDNDVLSGRGVNIAHHPGNERFRTLITSRKDEAYCTSYSASEKRAIAKEIIRHIQSLNPPGRFLKREGRGHVSRGLNGPWDELTDRECVKKTCQALRDCNRADRLGYAIGVPPPADVIRNKAQRDASGLTGKEQAAAAAAAAAASALVASTEDMNGHSKQFPDQTKDNMNPKQFLNMNGSGTLNGSTIPIFQEGSANTAPDLTVQINDSSFELNRTSDPKPNFTAMNLTSPFLMTDIPTSIENNVVSVNGTNSPSSEQINSLNGVGTNSMFQNQMTMQGDMLNTNSSINNENCNSSQCINFANNVNPNINSSLNPSINPSVNNWNSTEHNSIPLIFCQAMQPSSMTTYNNDAIQLDTSTSDQGMFVTPPHVGTDIASPTPAPLVAPKNMPMPVPMTIPFPFPISMTVPLQGQVVSNTPMEGNNNMNSMDQNANHWFKGKFSAVPMNMNPNIVVDMNIPQQAPSDRFAQNATSGNGMVISNNMILPNCNGDATGFID